MIKNMRNLGITGIFSAQLLGSITLLQAQNDDVSATVKSLREQVDELSQKIKILERKDEINDEETEKKRKENAKLTVSEKGFQFESADKNYSLRLRGLMQVDTHLYLSPDTGGNSQTDDGFYMRRIRPILQGTLYKNYEFLIVPDFGGTSSGAAANIAPTMQEAYAVANYYKEFQVQAGRFKGPFGIERAQSSAATAFVEAGLPQDLTPNYDHGVLIKGEVWSGILNYAAGAVNGQNDNASAGGGQIIDDNFDFVANLAVSPFKKTDIIELQGLTIGSTTTFGDHGTGSPTLGQAANSTSYVTEGQQGFFSYAAAGTTVGGSSGTVINGDIFRISPYATYYYGPVGILTEYVVSNADVERRLTAANLQRQRVSNHAWQVVGSYVLTGEDASYKGVSPKNNFSLKDKTWGAFELVARYGELNLDQDLFNTLAGGGTFATAGAKDARAFGLGVNWYLNKNVKALVDFDQTDFYGGTAFRESETLISSRLQLNF